MKQYFFWSNKILITSNNLFQANCTLLVYGLDSGWISPITSLLQSEASPAGYQLSDSQISWTASVLSMTAIFGTIIYSYIADRYGRKIAVIIIASLEAVSNLFIVKVFENRLIGCNFYDRFLISYKKYSIMLFYFSKRNLNCLIFLQLVLI